MKAKEFLDAGQLVPDELTIDIVRDRLSAVGRGRRIPARRLPAQRGPGRGAGQDPRRQRRGALGRQGLSGIVLDLEVDNGEVIKRISGRRLCRNDSGHIFHVDYSPSSAGDKCEICGGELYQRSDDAEDVVRTRLEVYAAETAPIIDYYREQGVLTTIDATGEVDVITQRAFTAVDANAAEPARRRNPRRSTPAVAPGIKGRSLAVLRNDDPSAEDLLDIVSDVETLAELIAAKGTAPPLAIALFGEWGAGKSSLMRQVEARVDELVGLSRERPAETSFVTAARQIRFNAWHYSDESLWLGLIDNLFNALSADSGFGEQGDSIPAAAADEISLLKGRRDACAKTIDQIDKELRYASDHDVEIGPVIIGRWDTRLRAVVLLAGLWSEVRSNAGFLAVWLALSILAVGVWTTYHASLVGAQAALIALIAPVRALWRTARKWWGKAKSLTSRSTGELRSGVMSKSAYSMT